ncbi:MAG: 8-oxo-dGTP diphosphatase MutT [Acidimicrobiia bacterium]|nr:8-oxo-dGTP diphosphatase MutT [Acidimicrobiia bacterium]
MRTIIVTAAIIESNGTFLVTRRPTGAHLEDCWEFPGGKCEPGEALATCLRRELHEELAIDAEIGDEVLVTTHEYADRQVILHFMECRIAGQPNPQEGQEMRWVARAELASLRFPPADEELIQRLTRQTARR